MSNVPSGKEREGVKAEHGPRSEVNWDGGAGHEPYANREAENVGPAHGAQEVEEGDRSSASGRNLEQLEAVKKKP